MEVSLTPPPACQLSPMRRTERVLDHVVSDLPSQARARLLVEQKVNSAIDAGVVDVIDYLFPRRVVQHHVGHQFTCERDVLTITTVDALKHCASGTRRSGVVSRITWICRCHHK